MPKPRRDDHFRFTPTKREAILTHLRLGHYFETAAELEGVHVSTARRWIRTGKKLRDQLVTAYDNNEQFPVTDVQKEFIKFTFDVDRALAEGERRDLTVIDRAAQGNIETRETIVTRELILRNGQPIPVLGPDGQPMIDDEGRPVLAYKEVVTEKRGRVLPQWAAAAFRLERRLPEKWGKKSTLKQLGDDEELPGVEALRALLEEDDNDTDEHQSTAPQYTNEDEDEELTIPS